MKNNEKNTARLILGVVIMIMGIVAGFYVGLYLMMVKPIMAACAAFDAGNLTGIIVGITVLKFIFGGTVCRLICSTCKFVGELIAGV